MLKRTFAILWAATAMGAVGCGHDADEVEATEGAVLGDALPGTNAATFVAAAANFAQTETVQDGAGPIAMPNRFRLFVVGNSVENIDLEAGKHRRGTP